ncbi:MAG: DUF1963 domain-containing protein [Lysobacter sp.]|nr:MAG: DUF1963 domain-containing protein [Lysobacter sp.]
MDRDDYFRLNGIEVGFSEKTEVCVARGRLRLRLQTPPMRLTRDLHNGMADRAWRPIPDFYMADGLRILAPSGIALPEGRYGQTLTWPYRDEREQRCALHVYGPHGGVDFFGTLRVEAGWLALEGAIGFGTDAPEYDEVMPISVRKRFEPLPLIPPRRTLSLEEALATPPDEVFELQIADARAETLSETIRPFAKLERLGIAFHRAGPCGAPQALPPVLFEFERLHTLYLTAYGEVFDALPPEIAALTRLEELGLSGLGLTKVSDALISLPRLERLNLDYNRLTTLPERIGDMPGLRELSIRGNRFVSLPKNLANIPKLDVDHPKRALFQDVGYRSKNAASIDESLFDLSRHPALGARLEKALDTVSDDVQLKRMALECSTYALYAESESVAAPVPLGGSKTGGAPHLPVDVAHPMDRNGLLSLFLAQIDLAEIAHLQPWLPRRGMLYFFVDDTQYAEDATVLYVDRAREDLAIYAYGASTRWRDSDLDIDNLPAEYALRFSAGVSVPNFYNIGGHAAARHPQWGGLFDEEETDDVGRIRIERFCDAMIEFDDTLGDRGLKPHARAHSIGAQVFTQHESPQEQAAAAMGGFAHEWMNLLCLESVGDFCFWDAGTLTFSVHKRDLAVADFARVVATIESS